MGNDTPDADWMDGAVPDPSYTVCRHCGDYIPWEDIDDRGMCPRCARKLIMEEMTDAYDA